LYCFINLINYLNLLIGSKHISEATLTTNKLQQTGQNLDRIFISKNGSVTFQVVAMLWKETAQLKVENLAQTSYRLSPIRYCAPSFNPPTHCSILNKYIETVITCSVCSTEQFYFCVGRRLERVAWIDIIHDCVFSLPVQACSGSLNK